MTHTIGIQKRCSNGLTGTTATICPDQIRNRATATPHARKACPVRHTPAAGATIPKKGTLPGAFAQNQPRLHRRCPQAAQHGLAAGFGISGQSGDQRLPKALRSVNVSISPGARQALRGISACPAATSGAVVMKTTAHARADRVPAPHGRRADHPAFRRSTASFSCAINHILRQAAPRSSPACRHIWF